MPEPSTSLPDVVPFGSFAELRKAHSDRVRSAKTDKAEPVPMESIMRFQETVRRTGVNLSLAEERQSAQNILDYWTAELVSAAPAEAGAWSPPGLAPFEQNTGEAAPDPAGDLHARLV